MEPTPDPELTAIYCRKSMKGDKKEITVNRQKRLALGDCEKLGLIVHQENIFIDNGASAWKRNRKRPGWDALIAKARRGEIRHIVMYHEDRGLRQPWDLEELLSISDEHEIMRVIQAIAAVVPAACRCWSASCRPVTKVTLNNPPCSMAARILAISRITTTGTRCASK